MDFENITQLEDYLRKVADDATELVEAVKSLPPGFVEGAHDGQATDAGSAQIEELRSRVDEHCSRLPECLAFLVEEIQRLSRNLGVISENRGKLHGERAGDEFAQAQEELEAEYNRALKMHSLLQELTELVGRALQQAAARGFARTDSPQQEGLPVPAVRPPFPAPDPSSLDGELDDLLSLGRHRPGRACPGATCKTTETP